MRGGPVPGGARPTAREGSGGRPHGARARLTRASGARRRAGGRSVVVFGGSFYWRSQAAVPVHVLDAGGLAWACYVPPAFRHFRDGLAAEPWMGLPGNRMLHLTAVRGGAPCARGARGRWAAGRAARATLRSWRRRSALCLGAGCGGQPVRTGACPAAGRPTAGPACVVPFRRDSPVRLDSPTCVVPSRLPQNRLRLQMGMAPHYMGAASDAPRGLVGRGDARGVLSGRCCWAAAAAAAAAAITYR